MKKVLFLTTIPLNPINSGGKAYSNSIIQLLTNSGYNVDILSFTKNRKQSKTINNEIHVHHRFRFFDFIFIKKVPHLKYYYRKRMIKKIKYLINTFDYDKFIFDHLHMGQYIDVINDTNNNAEKVLILHNVESSLIGKKYENTLFIKIFIFIYKKVFLTSEINIINKFNKIFSISKSDIKFLKDNGVYKEINPLISLRHIEIIKNNIEFKMHNTVSLLFLGNYNWDPNIEAAKFLLDFIEEYPKIGNYNLILNLVGANLPKQLIIRCNDLPNCNALGFVDNLEDLYWDNDIFVNSIFSGSGVNIKLLESIAYGIPSISTLFGLRGLEFLDDITLKFNSFNELSNNLENLVNDKYRLDYRNRQYKALHLHTVTKWDDIKY